MKFEHNQTVVALSHMDDNNAYIFGVSEYIDAYLPDTGYFQKGDLTGCILARGENKETHIVWEFQSQFFTKEEFRRFIGNRKVKRVYLDDELKYKACGFVVSSESVALAHNEIVGLLISEITESWIEEGFDDESKYKIVTDGKEFYVKDVEANKIVENSPYVKGLTKALNTFATRSSEIYTDFARAWKKVQEEQEVDYEKETN